jgi:hypothetical protein
MSHAADSLNPKRVVLNVKSLKSDEGIVKAFLRYSKHSEGEYDRNIHYIHLDPGRNGKESLVTYCPRYARTKGT